MDVDKLRAGANVDKSLKTIVKYLLLFDVCSMVLVLFYIERVFLVTILGVNIFMLGLYMLFVKYRHLLGGL
jgi:uncharacterized membrane protein YccC